MDNKKVFNYGSMYGAFYTLGYNDARDKKIDKEFDTIRKKLTKYIKAGCEKNPNSNKESFFREYRYDYFNNLIKKNKYNFIFTAHHYDDQIETLYMKTRGAYDWTKLIGIREYKEFLRRMHVVQDGKVIDGAESFLIIWKNVPKSKANSSGCL